MIEQESKIIFNGGIARRLLHEGCTMIDLKPDKEDPARKKSVYVFLKDDKFDVAMEKINNSIQDKRDREAE